MTYILQDLNVRDPHVTSSTAVMIEDTKVVVQSVMRLLTTNLGEIPNFRSYGLDLKQFLHYPLTPATAETIFKYVKDTLAAYETRVEIAEAKSEVDFGTGELYFSFILKIKPTNELVSLPVWSVSVGGI